MSFLKNEPIYSFKEDDYSKPRHIVVEGAYEEIGFDLATLARSEYGAKQGIYKEPVRAEARREYLARNIGVGNKTGERSEHNTFQRQIIFRDAYAKLRPPFKKEDATSMTDAVHCAFVDHEKAEAAPLERTLINTTAGLSKPEISVRWYLGDVGPAAGTNHMEDRMSDYFTFGFRFCYWMSSC